MIDKLGAENKVQCSRGRLAQPRATGAHGRRDHITQVSGW